MDAVVRFVPTRFRPLLHGEIMETGDVVMNDSGKPEFSLGEKHDEVGKPYEEFVCMSMMRLKDDEVP